LINFINDLINLTQGQLLVKHWWLWVSIVIFFVIISMEIR